MFQYKLKTNPAESAIATIKQEIKGLDAMIDFFDDNYCKAIAMIMQYQQNSASRVILSGIGKSGHIANKIAATLASTGTPAFFLHPSEASHGDLGMITASDLLILLSNSGENKEIKDLIYFCKKFTIPIIAITRNANSDLAKHSDISLILPAIAEANIVNAPTTSSTMMIALGDAIAVSLMTEKKFTSDEYRNFHPGGKLGLDLLKVRSVMRVAKDVPIVNKQSKMTDILLEITSKFLGCAGVVADNKLIGIITDGDLRRYFANNIDDYKINATIALDIMTKTPITISQDLLVIEAINLMNSKNITSLFVVQDNNQPIGILHLHDCLRIGFA